MGIAVTGVPGDAPGMRWLAVPLMLVPTLAAAQDPSSPPPFRCGTPAEVARIAALDVIPKPPIVLRGGADKLVRDGFGTHQKLLSPNFAINWSSANLTTEQAQRVADAAEDSWAKFVTELGHPPPTGCDTYRLNIYVSWDTDDPAIDYDGGYATLDDQGYPYLVISKNLVNSTDSVQGVVSHEIYHDFQFSSDGAYWSQESQWYWEATAEWGAQHVYPESQNAYGFVGALALTQELSLYFMGDPFAMDPTGQHQYGAGLFPHYLTDLAGDDSLVPRSWMDATSNDPLDVLDGLLEPGAVEGGVDGAIASFYAHNATWDYPQLPLFGWSIGAYEATYPDYEQQARPVILSAGTGGFVDVAPARPLHEHGAHQLLLSAGPDHTLGIQIEGDATGSNGTAATWWAIVVRDSPTEGMIYTPVPFTGADGELTVTLPDNETTARLTIGVHGDGRDQDETFGYQLAVGDEPAPAGPDAGVDPVEEDAPGCCSTGRGNGSGGIVLGLLVLVAMRRPRSL